MLASESLTMAFSQEEVVYLLALIQVRFIPGLGEAPLGEATEDQVRGALAGAERALTARGLVSVSGDGRRLIQSYVMGLVGTCAYPAKSLLLNVEPGTSPAQAYYFHVGPEQLTVEHTVPQNGIHLFTAYEQAGDGLARIASLLNIDHQAAPGGDSGKLEERTLPIALDLIAAGALEKAQQVLSQGGLDAATAAVLVSSLESLVARVDCLGVEHGSEPAKLTSYSLLVTAKGYWLLEPSGDEQGKILVIRPVAADALRALIGEQLTVPPDTKTG